MYVDIEPDKTSPFEKGVSGGDDDDDEIIHITST